MLTSYVRALSRLSGCLQFMQIAPSNENSDEEDEEDVSHHCYKAAELEVETSSPEISNRVRFQLFLNLQIMNRSSEILNNVNTVNVLVSALQLPNVLPDLCRIGHNLLLSDRLALHKCRYVPSL